MLKGLLFGFTAPIENPYRKIYVYFFNWISGIGRPLKSFKII